MRKTLNMSFKVAIIVMIGFLMLFQGQPAGALASKKADSMILLKAMEEELDRSVKNLGKDGTPAPYYIRYQVTETYAVAISATNGALGFSNENRLRLLDVDIRVGDHHVDNTHAMRGRGDLGYGYSNPVYISLDNEPNAIKSAIWLESDREYKNAVERLIQVKANQNVTVSQEDTSDDFSKENAHRDIGEPASIHVDIPRWERKMKEYSDWFKEYPEIYLSQVSFQAVAENKYFVDSEGTSLLHGRTHWRIMFSAATKAVDGMELGKDAYFDAYTPGNLPDDSRIKKEIKTLITDLLALRNAPVMEPFTGPAILSGRASAVFFHEIFGHRIEGHRQKDENEGQTFAKQVNQEILPAFISVYDDPGMKKYKDEELNGHYIYDDEGVNARKVELVKDGILKNFLMSRSPISGFPASNGHGRAQAGASPVSRMGNLVVESSRQYSNEALRQMLKDECAKQGKPYGLFFDDISGGSTHTMRFSAQAFDVVPVMVYRVFTDGRPDELVRGVNLIGTPLTSFSKIIGCGTDVGVFNGYCGAESGMIPASAIAPAILTSQIEVQKRYKESDKPPVLPPPPSAEVKSAGTDDPLIRAMNDEMSRSMKSLGIQDMDKPYYLDFAIWDRIQYSLSGTFGGLVFSTKNRQRVLKVNLRVGTYEMDNSGFLESGSMYSSMMGNAGSLVIDNDYSGIRMGIWLATDSAYKQALEQIASKRAVIKNQVQVENIPDYTKAEPVQSIQPLKPLLFDRGKYENLIRRLSAVFREFPYITDSGVDMEVTLDHKYYLNSEGTILRQPFFSVSLVAVATTQAEDGMRLTHFVPFLVTSLEQLPVESVLISRVREMATELNTLRNAPVTTNYIGPVLFTGQASGEMFAQVLAPNFSGQRPPLTDSAQVSDLSSQSKLVQRINRRILPTSLTVTDDSTRGVFENIPLIGSYSFDDEGIPSRPVTLVEKGILKTLLMSRRPRKDISISNGHGRSSFVGNPGVQVGNVFVSSEGGKSYARLKADLMQLCSDQGLPYGILIKTLDNPSITGMEFSMSASMLNSVQSDGLITAPVLVYRVDSKTGNEELTRGIVISEIGVKDLKYLSGIGNDYYVYNRIMPPGGGIMDNVYLFRARSDMGIPASIVSPSVLFEELEFTRNGDSRKKPQILPHPYFFEKK